MFTDDFAWMSRRAQQQVNPDVQDPFSDLIPSDLRPSRWPNRKRAKPLPKEIMACNNLSLLRRYVTPGGQIMTRTQSRLGAKDQRKVSKLIKRARHLGLIPCYGVWKYDDAGDLYAKDIDSDRPWEVELKERGYITKQQKQRNNKNKNKNNET
mmetsp:Transcript_10257/g.15710  ORF Transcript_10257/g.15710 Transcript_10257/m.15710 type:complete len:153 (-) Transcript_10257:52-510(-)